MKTRNKIKAPKLRKDNTTRYAIIMVLVAAAVVFGSFYLLMREFKAPTQTPATKHFKQALIVA